ncbi:crAss001_48 related protein [Bacteroides thetaiotaomicron]|uniref:crAss001_48 related protein n=1 Tax=Bacteroides thetaiotaomicron TaxID=818 RepID=UPI0034A449F6
MEPFIQRVIDEKAELDERAVKLGDFVKFEKFHSLDSEMQSLMVEQYDVMKLYSVILGKRLELLDA